MNLRRSALLLALFAFLVPNTDSVTWKASATDADQPEKPTSHTVRKIEGWTVRIDDRLLKSPSDVIGTRALRFLENKLADIKTVVPQDRLQKLQAVPIVVDLTHGKLRSMQYHPSADWLKQNGYSVELAKCVHLPRAADLATRRNIVEQPWVILHELAHAYHDREMGFDEPRIKEAYEKFKKSGHGEKVLSASGKRTRHYALTNPMEFFAEMTESYFGVNDFFPFNRAELKETEPEIYALLQAVWEAPPTRAEPAGVAAKAWAILDGKTGKPLWGFHDAEARPIASTTKIMTAWIILQRADKDPKLLDEEIRFSERAAAIRGSSCRLKVGERLPVRELLYGLLLPSGNDAAVALAEHFGSRLQSAAAAKEDSVRLFVAEMNRQAKSLKLEQTNFLDPNGLARNQASARDLAVLTWHAMQNRRFREYVKTRTHECEVLGEGDTKRRVTWKNTNRLLEDANCDGVKTGTTNAAGACLVVSAHQGADHLIVVVLGSTTGDGRYEDTRKLLQWAWEQRAGKKEKRKETMTLAPWERILIPPSP